jgi:hypothetical protein
MNQNRLVPSINGFVLFEKIHQLVKIEIKV